ncbi:hypothetical protein [Halobacillus litoralis]|nr:hypothetical protein [Halobacillus litoralis]MCA1021529.1 hypothetical protein [Halobacillus litoralis]
MLEVDTSEVSSGAVYFELIGLEKGGVICLNRSDAGKLAKYILERLKETQ